MLAKLRNHYPLIISTFLIIYFLVNLFGGERGLFSYIQKKEIIHKLKIKENELTKKIIDLDHINSLLSDNLDPDYIDILIREKFMFGKKGEDEGCPCWLCRSEPDMEKLNQSSEDTRYKGERTAKQVFDRLSGTWPDWGWKGNYFTTEEDAKIYFDESIKSTPLIDDQNDERIRKEIDFNPRSFEEGVKCLIEDVRENN